MVSVPFSISKLAEPPLKVGLARSLFPSTSPNFRNRGAFLIASSPTSKRPVAFTVSSCGAKFSSSAQLLVNFMPTCPVQYSIPGTRSRTIFVPCAHAATSKSFTFTSSAEEYDSVLRSRSPEIRASPPKSTQPRLPIRTSPSLMSILPPAFVISYSWKKRFSIFTRSAKEMRRNKSSCSGVNFTLAVESFTASCFSSVLFGSSSRRSSFLDATSKLPSIISLPK